MPTYPIPTQEEIDIFQKNMQEVAKELQKNMATGDPFCTTHGYNYCTCNEASENGYWIGDQKPKYDLLYRPENDTHKPPSFLPYYRDGSDIFITHRVEAIPHTRWSRCLMEIEEHWDAISGYQHLIPIDAHCSPMKITWGVQNYAASNNLIWTTST